MNNAAGIVIVMLVLVAIVGGLAFYYYQQAEAARLQAAMLAANLQAEQNKGGFTNVWQGIAKMFQGKF